jgi:two-component system chemotaxis sensor kinase CheA
MGVYADESDEHLRALSDNILRLEAEPEDLSVVADIFRSSHTLKGMSATMGFDEIADLTHRMESVLDQVRHGRMPVTRGLIDALFLCLDALQEMVDQAVEGQAISTQTAPLLARLEELGAGTRGGGARIPLRHPARSPAQGQEGVHVVDPLTDSQPGQRAQAATYEPRETPKPDSGAVPATTEAAVPAPRPADSRVQRTVRVDIHKLDDLMNLTGELVIARTQLAELTSRHDVPGLSETVAGIGRISSDLQRVVMRARMMPIEQVFSRFPRMVRDLARAAGKEVDLQITGAETEIDRTVIDEIGEPLVHLLRNAVDHGIEPPETRREHGKPLPAHVYLDARQEGESVYVMVEDDGGGIDPERVKTKALRQGLITQGEADSMTDAEAVHLLFRSGFTTVDHATEVSGRGVGMDVVRSKIHALGGRVEVDSAVGEGTTFTIELPLTLAIVEALLVGVGEEQYAIPLSAIDETHAIAPGALTTVHQERVISLRGSMLPLAFLREILEVPGDPPVDPLEIPIVVVKQGQRRVGLVVDRLIRQQEIVIKPLSGALGVLPHVTGAAILGDGSLALILAAEDVAAA